MDRRGNRTRSSVAERTWDAVERTRAEAALRQQTTRLSLALQASAGGSWTWDLRTNDADWDAAFREQLGFTPEEPALFDTWLARVHVEDRPRLSRTFEQVLQNRDRWDNTYRVLLPDGTVRWMQSLGRAERDETGQVTRLTGLELDVTERRRAEDALQARRDEDYDRRCERCSRPQRRASSRRLRRGRWSLPIVRSKRCSTGPPTN